MESLSLFIVILSIWVQDIHAAGNLDQLDWMVGTWVGQFHGKVRWPTIPTMTFGERITIQRAPVAKVTNGVHFYNFTAVSWAHSTKDHLHDEWGYMGVDRDGKVTLMTSGNNGFNKYEQGELENKKLTLRLDDIGRVDFTRDLPVEDMKRTFRWIGDDRLEQIIDMRTETHPAVEGYLFEHSRISYTRQL